MIQHSYSGADASGPIRERLVAFVLWGTLVGITFFSIYPTTNWLAENREPYALYLPAELHIPFVAEFIWLYLSLYGLFLLPPFFLEPRRLAQLARELIVATGLAGLMFLAVPARLGFAQILPDDPLYRNLFQAMFAIDRPFNLVPSLHVVYAVAIGLAVIGRSAGALRVLFSAWVALVVSSTLLVHQHHLLDVVTGIGLAFFIHLLMERRG